MRKTLLFLFLTLVAAATAANAGAQTLITGDCSSQTTTRLCSDSQTVSVSGNSITIPSNGGLVPSFEEVINGSPATVSVVIQGCGKSGTCDTLDTYTTVANAIRSPLVSKAYNYYMVTASWTGGTSPTVQVNTVITAAAGQWLTWTGLFGSPTSTIASPAVSTPYYQIIGTGNLTSPPAGGNWAYSAPFACTAYAVRYYAIISGTHDTAADLVTLNVFDVTTSTAFADSTATVALNGSSQPFIAPIVGMSDAIAQGDVLCIRATMPSVWATQPTSVGFGAQLTCI